MAAPQTGSEGGRQVNASRRQRRRCAVRGTNTRRPSVSGFVSTLATIWRLAAPYFFSEDRWPGRILLAAVIAIELVTVGINVILNSWNNTFYNALQDKDWNA